MSPTYILLRNCLITRGQKQIQARLGRWVLVRDTRKSRGVLLKMYSWGERWFHLSLASALFHSLSGCSLWFETVTEHLPYTPSVCRPRSSARPLVSSTFPIALPFVWFGLPESQFSSQLGANFTTLLGTFCACVWGGQVGGKRGRKERHHSGEWICLEVESHGLGVLKSLLIEFSAEVSGRGGPDHVAHFLLSLVSRSSFWAELWARQANWLNNCIAPDFAFFLNMNLWTAQICPPLFQ